MTVDKIGWYRQRSGELAYVGCIDAPGDKECKILGLVHKSKATYWWENGKWLIADESGYDLMEYLPDCTGWDWIERKWRTPKHTDIDFDSGKYPLVRCRYSENHDWMYNKYRLIRINTYQEQISYSIINSVGNRYEFLDVEIEDI